MKLNLIEYLAMNSKIRALHQDKVEMKILKNASSLEPDKKVLEIGCRNGYGTFLIQKYFYPQEIHSIDLDYRMIRRARRKFGDISNFKVASVTNLPFNDEEFDAVINFGIIHHVLKWRKAIKECARVLKHGGEFISEDLSTETWELPYTRFYKVLLDHPYDKMFSIPEYIASLRENKLDVTSFKLKYRYLFPFFSLIASKGQKEEKYPKLLPKNLDILI